MKSPYEVAIRGFTHGYKALEYRLIAGRIIYFLRAKKRDLSLRKVKHWKTFNPSDDASRNVYWRPMQYLVWLGLVRNNGGRYEVTRKGMTKDAYDLIS